MEQKRIAAMIALRDKMEFDLPENVVHNATQRRVNQLVQMNLERGHHAGRPRGKRSRTSSTPPANRRRWT